MGEKDRSMSGFLDMIDATLAGGDEPILVVNLKCEVCEIPRYVLRGVWEAVQDITNSHKVPWAKAIFHEICDVAEPKD